MTLDTMNKITIMVKGSPLFENDIKEKVLNEIRKKMGDKWEEPSLLSIDYYK